jgi:hypothetical protein
MRGKQNAVLHNEEQARVARIAYSRSIGGDTGERKTRSNGIYCS